MNLLFAGNYELDNNKINQLENLGYKVFVMKDEKAELPLPAYEINAVVCNWLFVNHTIEDFTNLRYIQLLSAGMDRVPMNYIESNNISIYNMRGVYSIPMAEYAITGVLQLIKKTRVFIENQKKHKWEKQRNIDELTDKTVCVLGLGSVGIEVAKKFSVFANKIIGVDIVDVNSDYVDEFYNIDFLGKCLEKADILVITLPLTEQTMNLINKNNLCLLKDESIIVNIARGKIINEEDLREEIKKERLRAVLDVFDEEPLDVNNYFWDSSRVVITPHNSFESILNRDRIWDVIISNLGKRRIIDNE